jgi:hypothetical protein
MKNPFALFNLILVCLAGLALSMAPQALHRGDIMASFLLLVIAMIFWKRSQARRF